MLASPAHSPYGSSSSAVSQPSTGRPRSARRQLDEAEVADEPVVVAAEPFEADDADRPRPEAALALEPRRDGGGRDVVQPLELDRAADPHERGARRACSPSARSCDGASAASSLVVGARCKLLAAARRRSSG